MELIVTGFIAFVIGLGAGVFTKKEDEKTPISSLIIECKVACGTDRVKRFDNLSQTCECIDVK